MSERIGHLVKRVQHQLRLRLDKRLDSVALTLPQYAALTALEEDEPLSGAELARRCFVTPQTMHPILAKLEEDGFVERRDHPGHGRVLLTVVTDEGRSRLTDGHRVVRSVEAEMIRGMDDEAVAELARGLRRCLENLERD